MTQPDAVARDGRPEVTVDDVADRYVDEYAAADPYGATYAGIAGHDARSSDLSPDGFAELRALAVRTLATLAGATWRDERERVAGEAMAERLRCEIDRADSGLDRALNVISSPVQWVREVFDLMPTTTDEQWTAVAARLGDVGRGLDGYRATLLAEVAAGRPPARRQVLAVADQCRRIARDFFGALVQDAPEARRPELDTSARAASAAYDAFATFLTDVLAGRARSDDAVGREVYDVAARYFLGATVDLDETYEWGVAELARIDTELAAVADAIVPGGSVDEAVQALDADPARSVTGTDALRAWMQDLSDRTVEALDGTHFDIPAPIRRLECRIAPTNDGGIYYTPPSEDLSRPGQMWWSVPSGVERFSTWQETTTVFHEGVPGHHLQIGHVVTQRATLNRWQRLLCWVSGHGEGWALYAERLMADLGFLDDPGDRLGMLDAQALRAARVVVDIGLHLGKPIPGSVVRGDRLPAGPWTPQAALAFLRAHTRLPEEYLRFELDRYLGWPGQAPSYKIGERIWLAARERARARHGASFDLADFHRAALSVGPLGLDPLRDALERLA